MAVGIRCTDTETPTIRKKLAVISPTSSDRSGGKVRSRTKAMEFVLFISVVLDLQWIKEN
jgi:hypothetical protein